MLQEVSELFVTKPSNDLIVSEPESHRNEYLFSNRLRSLHQ